MKSSRHCYPPVVLQTGFRLFFLGAIIYSIISMALWFFFYVAMGNIFVALPLTVWHGHEMIFGFVLAVVAGFLLTAVSNWTGLPTISGYPLLGLFLWWALARLFAFFPFQGSIWLMAICSLVFQVWLFCIVVKPIIQARQWRQAAILAKLLMLFLGEAIFLYALMQDNLNLERAVLKFAVYLIISLILTVGRRVIPFFIERGIGYPVKVSNNAFLDYSSLVLLVVLTLADSFFYWAPLVSSVCFLLTIVHVLRMRLWFVSGIEKKPLLWVLFSGYFFIIVGFIFKFASFWMYALNDSAMHAFTAGGIGIFVVGMMARVSWGHTGRNIQEPHKAVAVVFILLILAAAVRVFLPLLFELKYILFIALSQLLWMAAFSLFLYIYAPVLLSARVDGKLG